ncbi:hypothetical protein GCM10009839_52390 [Catenulispora yoronensis]|uniref:Uncharacterized protein n=1 Tax=Catenulispora yoronensis TaxID=450799 RepID=A0ABP5GEA5_9ACTN
MAPPFVLESAPAPESDIDIFEGLHWDGAYDAEDQVWVGATDTQVSLDLCTSPFWGVSATFWLEFQNLC